jgi:osmotically-inducible protein OsmY
VNRVLLLGVLILGAACAAPQKTDSRTAPAFRALGEQVIVEPAHSDEVLGLEVRRQITLAGPVDLAAVIIEIEDGVVTLRGAAPNQQAAWRAEGAARAVAGVRDVINQIQVTQPSRK